MDVRGKLAMVALVIQTTALVISLKYCRMRMGSSDELYTTSTAVTVQEFLKLLACLGVLYAQSPSYAKVSDRDYDYFNMSPPFLTVVGLLRRLLLTNPLLFSFSAPLGMI